MARKLLNYYMSCTLNCLKGDEKGAYDRVTKERTKSLDDS